MGVHPVQNHPDAMGMGGIAHGLEIIKGAQHGVGHLVVTGVVAMAGKALGDGIQVENGDPKGGNVVHFFRDPLEVAPEEIVVQHQAFGGGTPIHILIPGFVDGIGLQLAGQIRAARLAEPVGEQLIDDGALGPVGGVEILRHAADLPQIAGLHVGIVALLEQPEGAIGIGDAEMVKIQPLPVKGKLPPENIIGAFPPIPVQLHIHGVAAVFLPDDAEHTGALHGAGNVDVQGAGLSGCQGAEGVLVLELLAVVENSHG